MHYIIGTCFSIIPGARYGALVNTRGFNQGILYSLINISKKDDKVVYTFYGSDKSKIEMNFNSCSEGDKFISILRKEILPNYYSDNLEASFPLEN